MKKILTQLLLLTAVAATANAETKNLWTGPYSTGNWQGTDIQASVFSDVNYGDKITFSVQCDVEGATAATTPDSNQMYYQLQVRSWNNGEPTNITEGDDAVTNIEEDCDITIALSNGQVDAIKANGFSISGHFVTVNSISIDTEAGDTPDTPGDEGTTTILWEGTPVATGSDWSGYVDLSYGNKAGLANAKIGDDITVTFTTDTGADYANIQIGNPNTWAAYDEYAESSPSVTASAQTFSYNIPDVATLETIQRDGILVRGGNITITKVELTTYANSYDAALITIGEAGMTTYSNSYKALDFTNSGIKAYYASTVEKGKVTLTPIVMTPAYTGIIIKGEPDTYEIPVAEGEAPTIDTNYLKAVGDWDGTITASTTTEESSIFHYSFTETQEPTFSLVTVDTPIAAHKAYLETTTDITPGDGEIQLVFTDEVGTGITAVETETGQNRDNAYYNLQGMRVEHPTKGIYIHKGKKIAINR